MDFEVMKAYLPRFWDALLLTLRIGWQGVALALVLGVACAVAVGALENSRAAADCRRIY